MPQRDARRGRYCRVETRQQVFWTRLDADSRGLQVGAVAVLIEVVRVSKVLVDALVETEVAGLKHQLPYLGGTELLRRGALPQVEALLAAIRFLCAFGDHHLQHAVGGVGYLDRDRRVTVAGNGLYLATHAVGGVDANHRAGILDTDQNRAARGVRERNDFTVEPGEGLLELEALPFPFGQQ